MHEEVYNTTSFTGLLADGNKAWYLLDEVKAADESFNNRINIVLKCLHLATRFCTLKQKEQKKQAEQKEQREQKEQ